MITKIFGDPLENAVEQLRACDESCAYSALMADHHLGYSLPIGGVIAYEGFISPSGVGYDIACGNKAVKLDVDYHDIIDHIPEIMDDVFSQISFGVGRVNAEEVDHELFDSPTWSLVEPIKDGIKDMARAQLGTVGSGNHYVDIFKDEEGYVWIGVHFGSRGLGHKIATHFVKAGGGVDSIHAKPTLLSLDDQIGKDYFECMNLAGEYAYAGRDWVCQKVASIIGANIIEEVHNHHNFAWMETHFDKELCVVRKGATPAFPNQLGFVGGSMGENSVILKGKDSSDSQDALYSTVHGAGRVLSRTQAAGKTRWKKGKKTRISEGCVSQSDMNEWVTGAGVELRGGGVDESPHCYKRLHNVLDFHKNTIDIVHTLQPLGVAMAGADTFDPFKD